MIGHGKMFGKHQPVSMMLLDAPNKENIMEGIKMELEDSSLPLLREINFTTNLKKGF
jgi:hypothetical protein